MEFEVELISWKSENDLFGDGGVIRVAKIEDGEGWKTPKDGDWLEIGVRASRKERETGKMSTVWEKGLADEGEEEKEGLFFQLNLKKRNGKEDADNDDASKVPFGVHLALQFFKKVRPSDFWFETSTCWKKMHHTTRTTSCTVR